MGSRTNGSGSGAPNSPDSLVGLTRHAEEINDECLHLLHVYFQVRRRSARAGGRAPRRRRCGLLSSQPLTHPLAPSIAPSQRVSSRNGHDAAATTTGSPAKRAAAVVETHGAWLPYAHVNRLFENVGAVMEEIAQADVAAGAGVRGAGAGSDEAARERNGAELDACLIVQQLTRALRGGRVCCGAGAGESVALVASLEAALLLSKRHGLPGDAFHDTLAAMRMAGVWRQLSRANLAPRGVAAARDALRLTANRGTRRADAANPLATSYAFDRDEYARLPELLQPPRGSARCFLESVVLPEL